ncbi:MAG: 50S ribosomal protein L6 [bacterium]
MSRIGKQPIAIPQGTEIKIHKNTVTVKGPKGELSENMNVLVTVAVNDNVATVSVKNEENKTERSLWGLSRTLVDNMVIGVNQGYEKKLEINGVGYKAAIVGDKLTLNVGYSHPVEYIFEPGITAEVTGNVITIRGINKYLVGETAAEIRKVRKPEPYKGKGIKYSDEVIRRKAGKTAAKK